MTVESVVEVSDLKVYFPGRRSSGQAKSLVRAVDGVSFAIAKGEILALVGESGCGKSTIAAAIMRLVAPTAGRIASGGVDLATVNGSALRRARRRFQMIFQDPFGSLDPRQTVYETVVEPLVIHGVPAEERRTRVLQALEFAQLLPPERLAQRYPHELSGGQRQRVAIAAAVVLRPDLVVADEPVSMLDVSARAGILSLMVDLRDRLGISYLFITHDLSVAWVLADRIAVVYLGRIVEIGSAADLVAAPRHPYTQALLEVTRGDGHRTLPGETPSAAAIPPGCRFHPRCPKYRLLNEPSQCREVDPVLTETATTLVGHQAACHFVEENP
ncbi:MAG: ABC transporter ATP-binding protein [Actinomycetes bacterium]